MVAATEVLADLAAESRWLETVLDTAGDAAWRLPTPAPGWTIAHQIAHLAWTDDQALCAATDPAAFAVRLNQILAGEVTIDGAAAQGATDPPRALLRRWRNGRADLARALGELPRGTRIGWFMTTMSPASMATGRLMETWAHGQDIAETLDVPHPPTARLRHIAHIAIRARDYAFTVHGFAPPADPVYVELKAPDGTTWSWGSADAKQYIRGTALDFCLLATQRRHRSDTGLTAVGQDADSWLNVAQAFAGPPGAGREPRG